MEEGSAASEQDVKTGLLSDSLAVELFIVKYSSQKGRGVNTKIRTGKPEEFSEEIEKTDRNR